MKVVMNAVSAKMGGAIAYLRNFLPTLAKMELDDEFVVFVRSELVRLFDLMPPNIAWEVPLTQDLPLAWRLYFDQWGLRRYLVRQGADCLFSTANFGVLFPPVPQVTSVRNPVYFSHDYYKHVADVEGRLATTRVTARRHMVKFSCRASRIVVTPTEAMREMLLAWNAADKEKCIVINHGFDKEFFLSHQGSYLSLDEALDSLQSGIILFYPSLYGKHKNFDTLVLGMAELVRRRHHVRLFLTCTIDPHRDPYQRRTWELIEKHGLSDRIIFHKPVPYHYMPRIYQAADIIVWPSFAESFGHPLLEAMACEKPIVSSGIACNREMARDAALYFDTFEPEDFADKVEQALDSATAARLVEAGSRRVGDFSWRRHVEEFMRVFKNLADMKNG